MTQGGPILVATPRSHHAGKRQGGDLIGVRVITAGTGILLYDI